MQKFNRISRGDYMLLNSKGGRIIHIMADGTETEDLNAYIESHPEIDIPPVALRVMQSIFARSLPKNEM